MREENRELVIDWSRFKSNAKGKVLEKTKNSYIEFCRILDEADFELIGDYIGALEKTELKYKFNNSIKLKIQPNNFKRYTYKAIIKFKNELKKNDDGFIKFACITNGGNLIAKIKTFDSGEVDIDIGMYNKFNKGRKDFYDKLRELNGFTKSYYKNAIEKMDMCIDGVKLNSMSANTFKRTYKAIINFKQELNRSGDEFIKFISLTNGKLIVKLKTFDGSKISMDIGSYSSFNKSRQDTYNYCKEKGYKILSPYINNQEKILINFNCGHESNWIAPHNLKRNQGCPVCLESKGEKVIREYLEKNNINFIQEYKFEDCKYKRNLPFDFYIKEYNLCIEFDGRQHFEAFGYFGGEEKLKVTQKRDEIKNNYCRDNNINLLRIPYYNLDSIEKILDNEFDRIRNKLKEAC